MKYPNGSLDELGHFHRGTLPPPRPPRFPDDKLAHQIHAECLLAHQEDIPKSFREFEFIFPDTTWRDNSNFANGTDYMGNGCNIGYLCHPLLRWHWYENKWALEWYWFVDGLSRRHWYVQIPRRWNTGEFVVGPNF